MKKFAAFAAAALLLIPFVFVFASAAPVGSSDPDPSVEVTDPVIDRLSSATDTLPQNNLLSGGSYYSYGGLTSEVLPNTAQRAVYVYNFSISYTGGGYTFSDPVLVYRGASNQYHSIVYVDGVEYDCPGTVYVSFLSDVSSIVISSSASVSGTLVENDFVSDFGSAIWDVGSSIISFVTSSWLTLVALLAFVVVLCFGVVRRLVKGV